MPPAAAPREFHPAHADGCGARCFAGVQCASLIILPAHPRPQAATPVLRPGFVAHLFGRGPVLRTCNRLLGAPADRLHTGRSYPSALCCAGGIPPGFLCQGAIQGTTWKGGKHAAPGPESAQVKIQDGDNQFRFQPPAHIFIHQGVRKAVFVIACPHGQRSNIAGIVLDHPVHRFGIASDSGGDYR